MRETHWLPDFANFPRRDLTFKYTRRQLLTTITTEIEVSTGREQGGAGYRLARLGSLPDEVLSQVVPGVIPGCQMVLADGYVWGQPPPANQQHRLFKAEPAALFAFNQFNGHNTLNDISAMLCEETGWEPAYSFAFSRGLFLHLVQERICLPA
jgi:hypothetical protein